MLRFPLAFLLVLSLLFTSFDPARAALSHVRRSITELDQNAIANLSSTEPIQAALHVLSQPGVKFTVSGNGTNPYSLTPGDGGEQQLPWNTNIVLHESQNAHGSSEKGWKNMPKTAGFVLNRNVSISTADGTGSGIMPHYITSNYNTPELVKRAIIVLPGQPRDAWTYANLMLNARSVVAGNRPEWGISNDSVLILAPVFMSGRDMSAGAGQSGEISFAGEQWQSGGSALTPESVRHRLSSYDVLDFFVDQLFDKKQYPNLNQVVVAGHSLGGQTVARYALLKPRKRYDANMRFWTANAGSFAWLNEERPYPGINNTCQLNAHNAYNQWPFGIAGDVRRIPAYARPDVQMNSSFVIDRYLSRSVHYAFGLLDEGPGTTACAAQWQDANHLDRGSNYVAAFQQLPQSGNKFPAMHTADFIANVSHQPFAMYSSNISLQRIFFEGFNTRNADLTDISNPGDGLRAGQHLFRTKKGMILSYSFIFGALFIIIAFYVALYNLTQANYDGAWEKAAPVKRDWDEDIMIFTAAMLQRRKERPPKKEKNRTRLLKTMQYRYRTARCTAAVHVVGKSVAAVMPERPKKAAVPSPPQLPRSSSTTTTSTLAGDSSPLMIESLSGSTLHSSAPSINECKNERAFDVLDDMILALSYDEHYVTSSEGEKEQQKAEM